MLGFAPTEDEFAQEPTQHEWRTVAEARAQPHAQ
jgi:hypothetical protein